MRITHIIPNTPEWLEFRKDKIGSSDFATIAANHGLCNNMYNKSLKQLANTKKGRINKETSVTKFGHDMEPIIREHISDILSMEFEEAIFVNDDNSILMASLDGYYSGVNCNSIIEIKTISRWRKNFDGLLKYYLAQMCHEYYCAYNNFKGRSKNYLFVYGEITQTVDEYRMIHRNDVFYLMNSNNSIIEEIKLSYEYWNNICMDFYNYLK